MPVIAVAEELRTMQPEAEIHIAFTDSRAGMPGTVLKKLRGNDIQCTALPIIRSSVALPWSFLQNIAAARRLLAAFQPDVIFSKGGAAGLPLLWLAHRRKIPIVIHESDAVMGRANRFAARFATTICTGFPLHEKFVVTGNPIRAEVLRGRREEGLHITGFTGTRPILLVLGGSQGALAINRIILSHLPALLKLCDVIHITGPDKEGASLRPGYWARDFALDELPHLYACATFALSRSGASSIAELAAFGIPAILVPLRGLAQDHQSANARSAEQTGGCVIVQQEILEEKLLLTVRQILREPALQERMAGGMQSLSRPSAARRIAEIVVGTLATKPQSL